MGDSDRRRRVAASKKFADDCAKVHAAALADVVIALVTAAGNNSSAVLAAPCSACFRILRIFFALPGSASSKYSSQSLLTSSLYSSRAAIAANHASLAASICGTLSYDFVIRCSMLCAGDVLRHVSAYKRRIPQPEQADGTHGFHELLIFYQIIVL
jgi:hypothetical protein